MNRYRITLQDGTSEQINGANAYSQEGAMTTFFQTDADRRIIDSWSTRIASFRTTEVMAIRRCDIS